MKNTDIPQTRSSTPYNLLIGATVVDKNGTNATIHSLYQNEEATIAVLVLEDGRKVDADLSDFERHEVAFFTPALLDRHTTDAVEENRNQFVQPDSHQEIQIPVAQEEIHIDKRHVDTGKGVRVKKQVEERDEIINVPFAEERLSVKHVEVGQMVSAENLPQARQEGDTYIIPVFEEIYVIEKRMRLKEEVHITRTRTESQEPQKVTLRSEHVEIERFDEGSARS